MTDLYIRKNKDSKDTMKLSAYKDLSLLVDGSYLFLPKLTRRPLSSFDDPLVKLLLMLAPLPHRYPVAVTLPASFCTFLIRKVQTQTPKIIRKSTRGASEQ